MIYDIEHGRDSRDMSFGDYLDYPDYYDVMQFTGLYDKNGDEIYEGDLIEYDGYLEIVEFCNGKFQMGRPFFTGEKKCEMLFRDIPDDITIMGNKYENPSILDD